MRGLAAWSRRCVGICLVLLSVLPLHRLLDPTRTGPWAGQALDRAELSWGLTLWGTLTIALVAAVAAVLRRQHKGTAPTGEETDPPGTLARLRRAVEAPERGRFALGAALLAGSLASLVSLVLSRGLFDNVDEMASIIHARFLASGALAGSLPGSAEAWLIPNMLVVDAGWVSQYPPGHLLVLASFVLAGVERAVGPVLLAVMVACSAAAFERLLPPERKLEARAAALLLALSPFMLLLGGGALSHLTAGAAGAAALYFALRAADGRSAWAVAAGAAVGLMVLARPWTGILLGPVLTLGAWLDVGGPRLLRRTFAYWVGGGVPAAAVLFLFNRELFGSPLTLGYEALYGPAHGLGFHVDPWGFPYGLREAIGYTAADILDFGAGLLETPVSLTLVVGAHLALASRLPRGTRVVAAWALLPVLGNAFYWFHSSRMLSESAPAWILLAVAAITTLYARYGPEVRAAVVSAAVATLIVAVVALVPLRLAGHVWSEETLARITLPEGAADGSLVFVHASWPERAASLLHAGGMRHDSIESVVRRNDACDVHRYAVARVLGAPPEDPPRIALEQTALQPDDLEAGRAPGGVILRRRRGSVWPPECMRQVTADRLGSVSLAPLLWQGDLPGLEEGKPLFVRDYGPERNAVVRTYFPARTAFVFSHRAEGEPPSLIPYDEAMSLLWGRAP